MRFGSDYSRGTWWATGRSSTRGRGRGCLSGRHTPFQRAAGLDMAGGSPKAGGAFVQGTVDADVSEFPALEAGFMVSGVVTSEGGIVATASPPDFGVFKSGFFFFGQGRG